MRRNDFFKYLLFNGGNPASRSELETETLPYTFNSNSYKLRNYRIYGNTVNGESVGDLVTEGDHDGEYCVPVTITNGTDTKTTNIYLPKQIIKFGNEYEYIDYKKQKLYMVRKNLFDISAITENTWIRRTNGELVPTQNSNLSAYIPVTQNTAYTLSWRITEPLYSTSPREYLWFNSNFVKIDDGSYDVVDNNSEAIFSPQNAKYLRFDYDKSFLDIMLNVGSAPLSYEPYIANDELDVNLPALLTIAGTNTLSVGTNVQPSKVYLQGKISEPETVSAQSLQANMQSLQPLSLDDEDLELDVMPTDNDLQIDVKPIEKPVLNLNDVSEIENAEIERGVESAE